MEINRLWLIALFLALQSPSMALDPLVLYGLGSTDGGTHLMKVNPSSGAVEVVGDPFAFGPCTAMDFGPAGLFAVCRDEQEGLQALIQIDPQTGQVVRIVGHLEGTESTSMEITDLSFRSDGRLFGWQSLGLECATGSGGQLVRIDVDDGKAAPLGALTGCEVDLATGLAFDGADRLYLLGVQGLRIVDQSTGRATGLLAFGFATDGVDFNPLDGTMVALGGIEPSLLAYQISTGDVKELTLLPTTLTAMAFSPSPRLILANVVNGPAAEASQFRSLMTIINLSGSTLQPTVEFFDNDGTALEGRGGSSQLPMIEPQGTVHIPLTGLGGGFFNGWAQVSWEPPAPVQAAFEVALLINPGDAQTPAGLPFPLPSQSVATAVQSALLPQAHSFTSPGVITPFRESAFAIVNPSASESVLVEVQALRGDGRSLDINEIQIAPRGRVSLLLFELLNFGKVFIRPPDRPTDFAGSIHIRSDLPIAVSGLTVLLPEGKWTGLPVEPGSEF